jgi:hypothetical protein
MISMPHSHKCTGLPDQKKKINKETSVTIDITDQMNLTDIYRLSHSATTEFIQKLMELSPK